MNNQEARVFLQNSDDNCRKATRNILELFDLPESEYTLLNKKFKDLVAVRREFVRNNDLTTFFYHPAASNPSKKRKSESEMLNSISFVESRSIDSRKPISDLTFQSVRTHLSVLLGHIFFLSDRENTGPKTIAALALQSVCNATYDWESAAISREIASGNVGNQSKEFPLEKAAFLFDLLEIGKKKYTDLRRICNSEEIRFPGYVRVAAHRNGIASANSMEMLHNEHGVAMVSAYHIQSWLVSLLNDC